MKEDDRPRQRREHEAMGAAKERAVIVAWLRRYAAKWNPSIHNAIVVAASKIELREEP